MSAHTTDPHYPWHVFDNADYELLKQRYGDRESMATDWLFKRKAAQQGRNKPDGSPNPAYARLEMEEKLARMAYDMSFMLEANHIMKQQIEMFSSMFQRMAIIEGAYSHLMGAHANTKQEYYDRLKKISASNSSLRKAEKSVKSILIKES